MELHHCPAVVPKNTRTKSYTSNNPSFGMPTVVGDLDFPGADLSPPVAGQVLTDKPTVTLLDWKIRVWHIDGSHEDRSPSNEDFFAYGGSLKLKQAHPLAASQDAAFLAIEFPKGLGWATRWVKYEIKSKWGPSPADIAANEACHVSERLRLMEAFSVDRVRGLYQRVLTDSRDAIMRAVVDTFFTPRLPGSDNASTVHVFEAIRHAFEWNEAVVDLLPWWLLPRASQNYEEIRSALSVLPLEGPLDEFLPGLLTGGVARVYLPIRPGYETEALDFYTTYASECDGLVASFRSYRQQHFKHVRAATSGAQGWDEPTPPEATPLGASAWRHDWEKPLRRFDVLGEWSTLLPIDGVHAEPFLSRRTVLDEAAIIKVEQDLSAAPPVNP
jgi:hypothetical protein